MPIVILRRSLILMTNWVGALIKNDSNYVFTYDLENDKGLNVIIPLLYNSFHSQAKGNVVVLKTFKIEKLCLKLVSRTPAFSSLFQYFPGKSKAFQETRQNVTVPTNMEESESNRVAEEVNEAKMSRKEKKKMAKKKRRKDKRKEMAAKEREEEEARSKDPEEWRKFEMMIKEEEEKRERALKEFEERERLWIQEMELKKKKVEEEEEERRKVMEDREKEEAAMKQLQVCFILFIKKNFAVFVWAGVCVWLLGKFEEI